MLSRVKTLILSIFLCFSWVKDSYSQARLMLGATPTYMNISNGTLGTPIYLVIGNPANNGITRTAGWIISEGQYNYISWLQTTAINYVIPFGYSTTDYLPLTFNKTLGAASDLTISTWGTPSNNTPWANTSDVAAVTNMANSSFPDASIPDVIDRWWTINTVGATANLSFTYRGQENTMTAWGNTLAIQHWDGTLWNNGNGGGNGSNITTGSAGSNVAGPHTVTGIATFTQFSPYILVDVNSPLPIEFIDVSAICKQGKIIIKWNTASEQNSNYFTLEKSVDGVNFISVATIMASHNSNTVKNYSIIDNDITLETMFYRISETDYNGKINYSQSIAINPCSSDNIVIYNDNGININITAISDETYNIEVYNVLGQKISEQINNIFIGDNKIKLNNNLASAMYIIKVYNKTNILTKKIITY
jgi:hypothetical protein